MPYEYPPAIEYKDFTDRRKVLVQAAENVKGQDQVSKGSTGCGSTEEPPVEVPEEKKCALTELYLEDEGGGKSKSYREAEHPKIVSTDKDRLCFAPGAEKVKIHWTIENPDKVESATLDLFYRGESTPIWTTNVDVAGASQKEWDGTLGGETEEFPGNVPTVAHSPYKLKMTINGPYKQGCFQAWTYFDVLIHSIQVQPGKPEWLSDKRDDIEQAFRDKVIGTRKEKENGNGKDYGYEGEILNELQGGWERGPLRPVYLPSNLIGKKGFDFERYGAMWGKGPRIPLVAKPLIRKSNGSPADTNVSGVLAGMRFLWDWQDNEPDRWKKANATPTLGNGEKTIKFLAEVYKKCENYLPKGSYNCPVTMGGKLGDNKSPIFLAQDKAGDGNGSLPFVVKPCKTRTWASISEVSEQGETGVIFNPSRFAGDCYDVMVYPLFDEGLDSPDDLDPDSIVHGHAGTFEIFRRVTVHHLVVGDMHGDINKTEKEVRERARAQVNLDLDFHQEILSTKDYNEMMGKARDHVRKQSQPYTAEPQHPLQSQLIMQLDGAPGPQFFRISTLKAYKQSLKDLFRRGKLRLYEQVAQKTDEYTYDCVNGEIVTTGAGGKMYQLTSVPAVKEGETVLRKALRYGLIKSGDTEVRDGDTVTGEASGQGWKVTLHNGARSCWGRLYHWTRSDAEKTVDVLFPGAASPVTLTYSKKTFSRKLKSELSDEQKGQLRTAFVTAAKVFPEDKVFEIKITGRKTSKNSRNRIQRIEDYVDTLFNDELLFLDRESYFFRFCESNQLLDPIKFYDTFRKLGGMPLVDSLATIYAQERKLREGVIFIHSPRATNLADTEDAKNVVRTGESTKGDRSTYEDYKDMGTGAHNPMWRYDDIHLGLVVLVEPDPNAQNTDKNRRQKSSESVLLHELGHALFLGDHASLAPGRKEQGQFSVSSNPRVHVQDDPCIMDYDEATHQFCGLCMLRLRGWQWSAMDNVAKLQATAQFELGDMNDLFPAAVEEAGQIQMRLQALGLFNRPLRMGRPHQAFKEEFEACYQHSLKHAEEVLGTLGDDKIATLNKHLADFLVEGGTIPSEGKQAKLRLWGGFTGLYSQADIQIKYAHAGEDYLGEKPETPYMIAAHREPYRAALEKMLVDDNPGMGKIPISVVVLDSRKMPLADVPVRIELVPPGDPASFELDKNGIPVAGGKSFVKTCGTPARHEGPEKYLKEKIRDFEPSAPGNPMKKNAHVKLGGMREFLPDGNIVSSGLSGEPNLILPVLSAGDNLLEPAKDSTGSAIPFSVLVRTDDHGHARFILNQSRIGGDAYRFKATVLNPYEETEELHQVTSGDMFVWRSARACLYRQMPNVKTEQEMDPKMLEWFKVEGGIAPEYGELPELDIKGKLTTELAKANMELIVEEKALKPHLYTRDDFTIFKRGLAKLVGEYPDILNAMGYANINPWEVELKPKNGSARVFEAKFPLDKLLPDSLFIRQGAPNDPHTYTYVELGDAFAHDYETEQREDGRGPLIKLNKDDPVLGSDKKKAKNDPVDFSEEITDSWVDYEKGQVQITFKQDQAGKQFTVAGQMAEVIDLNVLMEYKGQSPFMFNVRPPAEYNRLLKGTGSKKLPMNEQKGIYQVSKFVGDSSRGLVTLGGIAALRGSIEGNQQSFFPGLVIFQAGYMDAFKQVQGFLQQGKGTGNTVWMFTPPSTDREKIDNLFVHEASHALMLMHAGTAGGVIPHLHDNSTEKNCVMSYATPDKNLGGYCGKCLAHLMGIWILREPLTSKGDLLYDPESPPMGPPSEEDLHDAGEPPPPPEPARPEPGISDGYGEFIVLINRNLHQLETLSYEVYKDIYSTILYKNSPFYHLKVSNITNIDEMHRLAINRSREIGRVLEGKSEDYRIVFIPRTLYELIFINKIMSQEIQIERYADWEIKPMTQYSSVCVDTSVNLEEENIQLSHKMNDLIIKKIQDILPVNETPNFPITEQQLDKMLENEIKIFNDNLQALEGTEPKSKYPLERRELQRTDQHSLGVTLKNKFGQRVANLITVIKKAIKVEIESTGKFILYRGTGHDRDSLEGSGGFPISYNTGLFAGAVYDHDGNTFTPLFILEAGKGYCLTLPYEDMIDQKFPFHIPVGNSLKQLFGHDQPYHAWTKTTQSIVDDYINPADIAGSHYEHNVYYVNDLAELNRNYQLYIDNKIDLYP